MELVGVVRCPVDRLCMYGERRQLNPKDVNRIAKRFLRVKCVPSKQNNHIRGIITQHDLGAILSSLRKSRKELAATTRSAPYPLLSNFRIACLDGRQRLAAAARHRSQRWWVVKLFCVAGRWVDFPVKLVSETVDERVLQDEVEAYSHESNYSDGEIYRLVRKYMRSGDQNRETECRTRLSSCREISLNGLLKHTDIRDSLDDLLEFPGVVGGLQLGNFHKHVALHCNEEIKHYFDKRIRHTWTLLTDNNLELKSQVDTQSVELLQLRIPVSSNADQREIERMFDNGEVFEGIKDPAKREQLKLKVLSLDVLIPSVETFHENMKFFSIGAKILRRYIMDDPPKGCSQTTLFQNLSAKWTRPAVPHMEISDDCLMPLLEPELTPYIAYKIVMLAALRNFPSLSTDSPRQDVRGETMPSRPIPSHIRYLQMLAYAMGFKTQKTTIGISKGMGLHDDPTFIPQPGPPADWRGGKPFTKTFLSLHSLAYLVNLSNIKPPADENCPRALFIMRDFMNGFFENSETYVIDDRQPGTRLEAVLASESDSPRGAPSQTDNGQSQASSDKFVRKEACPLLQAAQSLLVEPSPPNADISRVESQQRDNSTMLHDTRRTVLHSKTSSPVCQVNCDGPPQELEGPMDAFRPSEDTTLGGGLNSVAQDHQLGLKSTIDVSVSDTAAGTIVEDTLRRSSTRSSFGILSMASTGNHSTVPYYLVDDRPESHPIQKREQMVINGELLGAGSLNTDTMDRDDNRSSLDTWSDHVEREAPSAYLTRPEQGRLTEFQHISPKTAFSNTISAISEDTILRMPLRSPPPPLSRSAKGTDPTDPFRRTMTGLRRSTNTPEQAVMPSRMARPYFSGTGMCANATDQDQRATISTAARVRPKRSMRITPQSVRVPPIRSMRVTKRTEEHHRVNAHRDGVLSQTKEQAGFENGKLPGHDGRINSDCGTTSGNGFVG